MKSSKKKRFNKLIGVENEHKNERTWRRKVKTHEQTNDRNNNHKDTHTI